MDSGFKSDFSGLEKLAENMEKTKKKAEKISFDNLFSSAFMKKYSKFSTFGELLKNSGFKVETEEDFKDIPDIEFDAYIKSCTKFNTWEEMLKKAYEEYLATSFRF